MKRHSAVPEAALEAGRALSGAPFGGGSFGGLPGGGAGSVGSKGNVSMMVPPNIQPYQASVGRGSTSGAAHKGQRDRDSWSQLAAIGMAVWVIGCFMGYSIFWPLMLAAQVLGWFFNTPFTGMFGSGAPTPVIYPAASELKLPTSQVARYAESYMQTYGDAALIYAAHDGYPQLVSALLLSKESGFLELVDAADESGATALLYASGRGFAQVAAVLLRAGADPDARRQGKDGHGLTSLMEAAGTGHREIVTLLLEANATIDLRDEGGNTALMYGAQGGHLGAVQELLHRGAMRDLANQRGDTALSLATATGNQAMVDALQRGARPVVEKLARQSRFDRQQPSRDSPAAVANRLGEDGAAGQHGDSSSDKEDGDSQGLLASAFARAARSATQAAKDAVSGSAASKSEQKEEAVDAKAGEQARKLQEQLVQLKREHEAADLKSQRRIVELLEQSSDKQKQLDEMQKLLDETRTRSDDLSQKLRSAEERGLQDEMRHADLAKEAHESRMQFEQERSKVEAAEREKERHQQESKRLEESLKRLQAELEDRTSQVDRLRKQADMYRSEATRAEDDRRAAQRQLELLHAANRDSGLARQPAELDVGRSASLSSNSLPVGSEVDAKKDNQAAAPAEPDLRGPSRQAASGSAGQADDSADAAVPPVANRGAGAAGTKQVPVEGAEAVSSGSSAGVAADSAQQHNPAEA